MFIESQRAAKLASNYQKLDEKFEALVPGIGSHLDIDPDLGPMPKDELGVKFLEWYYGLNLDKLVRSVI